MNRHIRDDEPVIYDIDIEAETDDEETQANNSALTFLSGSENHKMAEGNFKTGFQLATYCLRTSAAYKVDPGVIALNYAYNYKNYPLAQLALKILDPKANAVSVIKSKMENYLHLDNLSEENLEFFKKVTAVEGG